MEKVAILARVSTQGRPRYAKRQPNWLPFRVDYIGKVSNLLEDIKKVERFAQYIENQASENMAEMEGSEIKQ